MYLTKSIEEYWSIGVRPPEECLLQMTKTELTRIRGELVHRCYLSDGHNLSSLFHYQPRNGNCKPLPAKLSVIRIKNVWFRRCLTVWFIFFDDVEVVAESQGRIKLIGNPRYLDTDPLGWKPWFGVEGD